MGRGALGLNTELDIRHLLARVAVPALVIHRTNEQWVDVGNSRYLAAHIDGAQLIEASGVDHRPWLGNADEILDAIETFLTGRSARPRTRRYAAGAEALSRREREIVALTGQPPDSVQVRMLARPSIRNVLTWKFTRGVPPLLVWLKVADAGDDAACVQHRRPLATPARSSQARPEGNSDG